jgi:hypothetical protein
MKFLTKNLLRFALVFLAGAILFRYSLSYFLENHWYDRLWIISFVYFFFNLAIGWYFGRKDREWLPIFDIGFRFHFVTYLIFNAVCILWFRFGLQTSQETIGVYYYMAMYWGLGLAAHFLFYLNARRHSIKGISKSNLFE